MVKTPTEVHLETLTVPERILLFCVASGSRLPKTKITRRKREPDRLALTVIGRPTGGHADVGQHVGLVGCGCGVSACDGLAGGATSGVGDDGSWAGALWPRVGANSIAN